MDAKYLGSRLAFCVTLDDEGIVTIETRAKLKEEQMGKKQQAEVRIFFLGVIFMLLIIFVFIGTKTWSEFLEAVMGLILLGWLGAGIVWVLKKAR